MLRHLTTNWGYTPWCNDKAEYVPLAPGGMAPARDWICPECEAIYKRTHKKDLVINWQYPTLNLKSVCEDGHCKDSCGGEVSIQDAYPGLESYKYFSNIRFVQI